MSAEEARRSLLADGALRIGVKWARSWCEDLRRKGRSVSGGWPGTLREARARVAAYLGQELADRRMAVMTHDELGSAAHAAYQEAKGIWLTSIAPRPRRTRAQRMERAPSFSGKT